MHLGARDFVHAELSTPRPATPVRSGTAAAASSCSRTSATARAAPPLPDRDHVEVRTGACACGRTSPRIRCLGRTDDMLIVRGVNVFPSAVRRSSQPSPRGQRPHRRAPGAAGP